MQDKTTTSATSRIGEEGHIGVNEPAGNSDLPDVDSLPDDPVLLRMEWLRLVARLRLFEKDCEFSVATLADMRELFARNLDTAKRNPRYRWLRRLAKMLRRAGKTVGALRTWSKAVEQEASIALIQASGTFDLNHYSSQFDAPEKFRPNEFRRAVKHYLNSPAHKQKRPFRGFDSRYYLAANPDVAASGGNPLLHFLHHGMSEGRYPSPQYAAIAGVAAILAVTRNATGPQAEPDEEPEGGDPLEQILPGVTAPVAIARAEELERKLRPVRVTVKSQASTRHANIVVPHLHPAIIFGGYTAYFKFVSHLKDSGIPLRFIVVEPMNGISLKTALEQMRVQRPEISSLLDGSEVYAFGDDPEVEIPMGRDDIFVAYSSWTAFVASDAARQVGRRHFIYFIQEYEPIFLANNSVRVLFEQSYRLPHVALFNSAQLADYFREEKIGVFDGRKDTFVQENSGWFAHALTPVERPSREELSQRPARRLLFYARPERHAERNLFEIGVLALRAAIKRGCFPGHWEFIGVGSLRTSADIALGSGNVLRISPRLDGDLYGAALKSFDVGLSLIYAPHPGLVHFEMAAAGLIVVTNTFANRSADDLSSVSRNIIGVPPYVDELVAGLSEAARRCEDVDGRMAGLESISVSDWKSSFAAQIAPLTRTMVHGSWP